MAEIHSEFFFLNTMLFPLPGMREPDQRRIGCYNSYTRKKKGGGGRAELAKSQIIVKILTNQKGGMLHAPWTHYIAMKTKKN